MRKSRKHYSPDEKVAILRRHLIDKAPVSDLCDEYRLNATVFYNWQKCREAPKSSHSGAR